MRVKDEYEYKLKGELIFRIYKKGVLKEIFTENIVVNQSREFMRNLTYGEDDNVITKILIGDMNKKLGDEKDGCDDPKATDTDLVHTFLKKDYESKEKTTVDDRPAIKYIFVIKEDEGNDDDNDDHKRKLWCEYGLADKDDHIWTRKTKPIIKDDETKIEIDYILNF